MNINKKVVMWKWIIIIFLAFFTLAAFNYLDSMIKMINDNMKQQEYMHNIPK